MGLKCLAFSFKTLLALKSNWTSKAGAAHIIISKVNCLVNSEEILFTFLFSCEKKILFKHVYSSKHWNDVDSTKCKMNFAFVFALFWMFANNNSFIILLIKVEKA